MGGLTGASYREKSDERNAQRNGTRERDWETRAGTVELRIPKLGKGSYFPGFLEPRRLAEKALTAIVQEAYSAEADMLAYMNFPALHRKRCLGTAVFVTV